MGQLAWLDALYWSATGLGPLAQGGIHPALLSSVITGAVVTGVTSTVALTLVFRGPVHRGARPLALALSGWAYLLAYSGLTVLLAPAGPSLAHDAFDIHFLAVEALALAALLRFTAIFPTGLNGNDLQDPDTLPVGLRTLQHLRRGLLHPVGPWLAALVGTGLIVGVNRAMGRPLDDAALHPVADAFRLAVLAVVILNMRRAFVLSDEEGRRHMFWFVVGFTLLLGALGVLLGGNVLVAVTGWEIADFNWRPVILDLGVVGLIWGAAMGVFYQGPMKPGRTARRLSVTASAVTLALFLSAGMESLLVGVVPSRLSVPQGIGTLVSLLAVGMLYVRVHRPLESMIYNAWAPPRSPDGPA